jgi:hypothetical protein
LIADLPQKYFLPGALPSSTEGPRQRLSLRTLVRAAAARENGRRPQPPGISAGEFREIADRLGEPVA